MEVHAGAESTYGLWRRLGFALGDVGIGLGAIPTNMLFLFYLTQIVGLRPGLAGLALALPKIWDALVDPMLGGWTDQFALRLGRRTPIALVSGAVYLASLVLMFSLPRFPFAWQTITAATLILMASSTAMTAFGVSKLALATEMTRGAAELSALLSLAAMVVIVFNIGGAVLVPMLIPWSGGGRAGYTGMAAEVAIGSALAVVIFVLTTRRVPVRARAVDAEVMPLFASIRATGANHAFYFLMAYLVCFSTGNAILGAFLPFANSFVLLGDQASLGVIGGISAAMAIVGLPFAPLLARRFGAIRSMRGANLTVAGSFALLFLTSFGPIWLNWIAVGCIGVAVGALAILLQTALLEVAQFKLNRTVVVPLGFYLGILVAGTKLGASAGSFAAGELLDLIGFLPGGAHQTAATISWLRLGYTLIPFAFFAGGGLFLRQIKPAPTASAGAIPAPSTSAEDASTDE